MSTSSRLPRVLEPEAMDSPDEACAYDAMDHSEVNARFVSDLLFAWDRRAETAPLPPGAAADDAVRKDAVAGEGGTVEPPAGEHPMILDEIEVLDLGTGTAQIPVELCRRSGARVVAVDLATSMLDVAMLNVEIAGLRGRILLDHVDAKRLPYEDGRFACVMSNSIVHHIPDPRDAIREAWRVLAPSGLIFARDLFRPRDEAELELLVQTYAGNATEHQRQLFRDSLHAALTVEEMQQLVQEVGAPAESVQATSDRHWTWAATKSPR